MFIWKSFAFRRLSELASLVNNGYYYIFRIIIEGVRARVSQPLIYNSCRFSFKYVLNVLIYRTNRQELYIEGWLTLALTPPIIM